VKYFKNGVSIGLILGLTILAREWQEQVAAVFGKGTNPIVNRRMAYTEKACNLTDSNVAIV
jgi:hypothetical protein